MENNAAANENRTLPMNVIARWDASDWNDEKMAASEYRYEDADTRESIELTEDEASRYAWGTCQDNLAGGSQRGELRVSGPALVRADYRGESRSFNSLEAAQDWIAERETEAEDEEN